LFLGIIASALTETDDSWQGRLGAVLVTLACFSAAAYAVEFLFPYPWLFVIALAFSAFCLTMLGALGERFATLGSGTLILAVYSMIGVEQRGGVAGLWLEPLLLVAGAAWYGLLSVIWHALFAHQPVQLA
ncbi:FUSC family membrane protein, partial [Klebsiella pneumoniae]